MLSLVGAKGSLAAAVVAVVVGVALALKGSAKSSKNEKTARRFFIGFDPESDDADCGALVGASLGLALGFVFVAAVIGLCLYEAPLW